MAKLKLSVEGIRFENFRIFKNRTDLDFKNITVLTGANSSGKSTVINGMRLIKGNYSDLKFSERATDFELDSVFEKNFDVGEIISRYGDLGKCISFDADKKDEFTFSLQKKMRMIDDTAIIDFTVQIQDNNLKNGKLIKLEMKSKSTGFIFLTIYEKKKIERDATKREEYETDEQYFLASSGRHLDDFDYLMTQINLNFFYDHYLEWIIKNNNYYREQNDIYDLIKKLNDNQIKKEELENAIKNVNEKYEADLVITTSNGVISGVEDEADVNPYMAPNDIGISKKDLNEIIDSLTKGKFYDFSSLWAENPEHEELFVKMITNVYGKYDAESLKELTTEILSFLSNIEWKSKLPEIDSKLDYLYFNDKRKVSGLSLSDYAGDSMSVEELKERWAGRGESFLTSKFEAVKSKSDLINFLKSQLQKSQYKFSTAEDYFYNNFIFHNLNLIKNVFRSFKNAEFISADRSSSERSKSLSDEDDLSRLSRKLFSFEKEDRNIIDAFLNKWQREFGIAEKVTFEKDKDTANFKIFINKDDRDILLADMGFGVSQLLPIILACYPGNKIVAIEEPETNLHPALQSKLADFFIDAAQQFNIQFIIETHSEYLIRKLQYLTAKTDSNLEPEDTVIYYFSHPDKVPVGEDQVKKININDDGSLTDDFGTGFFDEALHWKFELIKLTNPQKN